MGVLHGRDLLSSKFVTAIITDSTNRVWFVPIKTPIDDYFLANLNGQIYCFKIGNVCQYREKFTKQFQVIFYNTSHYMPINDKVEKLKLFLKENGLPRVNGIMSDVLKILGRREKNNEGEFKEYTLDTLVKEIDTYEKKRISKVLPTGESTFNQQAKSIVNFLNELDVKKIVTPTRAVSEFIEDDLKSTDAKFPGVVLQTLQALDHENKKVTNTPVSGSKQWMLPMMIVLLVAGMGFAIYILYDMGAFDELFAIGDSFSNLGENIKGINPQALQPAQSSNNPCSDRALQKKYPEPVQLKIAVEDGTEKCKLSPVMKQMIDNIKLPKASPKS